MPGLCFSIVHDNYTSNNLSLLDMLAKKKTSVSYFKEVVGTDLREILK